MSFIGSLWKSIYSVSWYNENGTKYTFGRALSRYMCLSFWLMVIVGLAAGIAAACFFTTEKVASLVAQGQSTIKNAYPQNLAVSISAESGVITNSTGPVYFPLSSFGSGRDDDHMRGMGMMRRGMDKHMMREDKNDMYMNKDDDVNTGMMMSGDANTGMMMGRDDIKNLLVIDTLATPTQINDYNTVALLTKDALVVKEGGKGQTRLFALKDMLEDKQPINITSGVVDQKLTEVGNNIVNHRAQLMRTTWAMVAVVWLIVAFVISFFVGLFTAIALFVYAIGLRMLSKAMGMNHTYTQSYSYAAAGFVLPFLFGMASWWFKLALLCVIVGRIWYLQKQRGTGHHTVIVKEVRGEDEETVEVVSDIIDEDDVK